MSTGTTSRIGSPETSIDYIFTDPPFGENIYYADLNFLVESWHQVLTKDEVLQEDSKLLMFYDQALTRAEQS